MWNCDFFDESGNPPANFRGDCRIIIAISYFTIVFVLGLLLCSCGKTQYSFQMFTFPEEIPPHEKGWQYRGIIVVTTKASGPMTKLSNKEVAISIENNWDELVLKKSFDFSSVAGIKAAVDWRELNDLVINLYEYDNVEDEFLDTSKIRLLREIRLDISKQGILEENNG